MKSFLAWSLMAVLAVFTIGCQPQKDTTGSKTETITTQTKDGEMTGERTTTVETKTSTTPVTPDGTGTTTEKTTKTTTETTR